MRRYTVGTLVLEVVMIVVALVYMIPIYVMINIAVRGPGDSSPSIVPTARPTFDNFVTAWNTSGLGQAMLVSAVILVFSVGLIVICGSLASYAIVRLTGKFSSAAFYIFLLGLLLPFQLMMIPMYQNFVALGTVGNPFTLVIIYVGLRMPFTIFLYSAFLRQMPVAYEEAAALDGASHFQRFRSVVFPLLRPVTGTVIILNGLFVWNDFFIPLLYLNGTPYSTVPLAIYSFVTDNTTNWSLVFAALIISAIPIVVSFFILQRSLIQGFASGVKG